MNALTGMLAATSSSASTQNNVNSHTRFDNINVVTQATNAVDMARDMRRALTAQPLLNPLAAQTMTLATRGSQ